MNQSQVPFLVGLVAVAALVFPHGSTGPAGGSPAGADLGGQGPAAAASGQRAGAAERAGTESARAEAAALGDLGEYVRLYREFFGQLDGNPPPPPTSPTKARAPSPPPPSRAKARVPSPPPAESQLARLRGSLGTQRVQPGNTTGSPQPPPTGRAGTGRPDDAALHCGDRGQTELPARVHDRVGP
jgi:hypothetical protein